MKIMLLPQARMHFAVVFPMFQSFLAYLPLSCNPYVPKPEFAVVFPWLCLHSCANSKAKDQADFSDHPTYCHSFAS